MPPAPFLPLGVARFPRGHRSARPSRRRAGPIRGRTLHKPHPCRRGPAAPESPGGRCEPPCPSAKSTAGRSGCLGWSACASASEPPRGLRPAADKRRKSPDELRRNDVRSGQAHRRGAGRGAHRLGTVSPLRPRQCRRSRAAYARRAGGTRPGGSERVWQLGFIWAESSAHRLSGSSARVRSAYP